jgi:heat shock protein HslJ
MKKILNLFLAVSLLGISCKTQKEMSTVTYSGGSEDIFRYQWTLSELNGVAQPNSKANLAFSPGQVSRVTGSTSCNRLNGTFELIGDHMIKFGPAAVTKMACMDANVEAPFLKAINEATHWSIAGKEMRLYNGTMLLAKFNGADAPAGMPTELTGTWELEYITGPRIAFDGLYPEKKPTIILDGSSDFKGNTSCNGMGGKFSVNGATAKFNAPITTMMACPGAGEQTFLKTLDMVDGWAVEGGKLVLKSKGLEVMRFARK